MRPKKPARHTVSILTGRKKTQYTHLCSSVIPNPIGTKFATYVPASYGSLHTKFEENRSSHFRDTSEQMFVLISSFFSSSSSSFRTLRKIYHKTRMRTRIGLNCGTLEGLIKADLSTNFGKNSMNIHGVMTDYARKPRLWNYLPIIDLSQSLDVIKPKLKAFLWNHF